ncbi:helix-turn-helix domain-containing protein [Flavihumibacter sp.]|uniref:helix-turn-helix domain-containing protein n=1 Tax=Flavihumibacter sp. TaxID=1913981 RepID=UPI002FCAE721
MKSKETDNWGQKEILAEMGKQIRLKRYLSNISISFAAFNTGLSRSTIHRIENGDPGVSIGAIYKLLVQIGEEKNLLNLAGVNEIVEALVENKVLRRPRAKKKPGRTIELGQSHMKELMT